MALFGDAAISFFLETLFHGVFTQLSKLNPVRNHELLRSKIRNLEDSFRDLQAVRQYAEKNQATDPTIRKWLEDVDLLTSDAENLTEDFFLLSLNNIKFNPRSMFAERDIEKNLSSISSRLENLKANLHLQAGNAGTSRSAGRGGPSGPISTEPVLFGRTEEKERLVRRMTDDTEEDIDVIPIVGMGGLGKTTLAQFVYNDDAVKNCFEVRAWVWVSKDFDILRISKGILEAVTCTPSSFHQLGTIQNELRRSLAGKKFLIVLDDFWNPSYQDWKELVNPLNCGVKGNKLIVTTRNTTVADRVSTLKKYEVLTPLSENQSWELFCRHCGLDPTENSNSIYERTGREIAKKCNGLPLAIMALGGLLRLKDDIQDWTYVLKSKSWVLTNDEVKVKSVLRMSYDDLPSGMKNCFAMCAMFPRDYKFYEKEVVLLWLGAGLVGWDGTRINVERKGLEIGHVYFQQLIARSIFLPFNKSRFYVHDLFREIAGEISGMLCCNLDESDRVRLDRTLHLSYNHLNQIDEVWKAKKPPFPLRTLYRLYSMLVVLSRNLEIGPILKLRYLRILSLSNSFISKLPKSICNLKHLRSLDLSRTLVKKLPSSITSLHYLEILDLSACKDLAELPVAIGKLKNLRYLDASETAIIELPCSLTLLINMEILILYSCSRLRKIPTDIGSLKNLKYLDLMLTNISTLPESISSLVVLEYLILRECSSVHQIPSSVGNLINLRHVDVSYCEIESLPNSFCSLRNLETLNMACCVAELPAEISSLTCMRSLIYSSIRSRALPSSLTGLYNLEVLDLSNHQLLEELPEQVGNLRRLKLLDASSTNLKRLPPSATLLSRLEDLNLSFCRRLDEVPEDIGRLSRLKKLVVSRTQVAVLPRSLTSLSDLETLDLSFCERVDEMPDDLGDLKNLRTLKLLHCGISKLPDSATSLCSLETLELSQCEMIEELPADIGKLKRLKILNISWCRKLKFLPDSITELCYLELLDLRCCPYLSEIPLKIGRMNMKIVRY